MMEETLFIIKPDGWNKRTQIMTNISERFNIIHTLVFEFNSELIAKFYPTDMGKHYYPALEEYMLETPCELGVIKGNSVIDRFFEFSGKLSDPKACEPNTLRYRYGNGLDTTTSGLYIVKNAVHRVKSKEEYEYETELFGSHGIL